MTKKLIFNRLLCVKLCAELYIFFFISLLNILLFILYVSEA